MIEIMINKGDCLIHLDKDPSKKRVQLDKIKNIKGMKFKNGNRHFPVSRLCSVLDCLDDFDVELSGNIPKDILSKIEQEEQPNEPFDFKTKPFPHQLESFNYAKTHNRFLLGDEQGLGKTKQAIDIAVSKKGPVEHVLIVACVNGLKWNWLHEIETHSNEKGHIIGHRISRTGSNIIEGVSKRIEDIKKQHDEYFYITNIESLRDKEFAATIRTMCQSGKIGMVIIDEVHKCKNPTSQQGKALEKLDSYYRIALTGTPMMNSPVDLYNVLKWLGVEHHTYTAFKEYYCIFGTFGTNDIVGYKHLGELEELLNSVMLRRLKTDVLDLPDKIRSNIYIDMANDQKKIYNEALSHIRDNIDKVMLSPNPLAELVRLRQCTSYPGILTTQKISSAKFDKCIELIENAIQDNDKVIIFSNWTSVIYPLAKLLDKYNPSVITGDIENVDEEIDIFKHDDTCKVILGTIKALGTGYTLTESRTVIFLDEPWTMADKEQAEDRAHRIGTAGTVNVYTLLCKDTIDERINELVESKGMLSDRVVDGVPLPTAAKDIVKFLLD